jgi:hypothetical protein
MNDAIAMLAQYGNTTAASSARTFEGVLESVLDSANNDLPIFAS